MKQQSQRGVYIAKWRYIVLPAMTVAAGHAATQAGIRVARGAAARYIRSMFEEKDHVAVLGIPRRGQTRIVQEVMNAEKLAQPETQERLRKLNDQGYDVYCTVNTVSPRAQTRTKADVTRVKRLQLDLDDNGREGLARLRRDVDAGRTPPPAVVMQSSRGRFQVLWNTEPARWTAEKAEETMRRLAARYGGDRAVADVARVMRVPGFRNCKDGRAEWAVTWARYDGGRTTPREYEGVPVPERETITPNLGTDLQDEAA